MTPPEVFAQPVQDTTAEFEHYKPNIPGSVLVHEDWICNNVINYLNILLSAKARISLKELSAINAKLKSQ